MAEIIQEPTLKILLPQSSATPSKQPIAPPFILYAHDQSTSATMGGKAASLARLQGLFPIPEWFVITPAAFLASLTAQQRAQVEQGEIPSQLQVPNALAAEIEQALESLASDGSTRFAVRSSATSEDGTQASFAGQLESFLNLERGEILKHVVAVWRSAFASHVDTYRHFFTGEVTVGIPAVLVQRMVQAEIAGVAFSADPVRGDRERCLINAVVGLGDKLVGGEVNGDTYVTRRDGTLVSQSTVAQPPLLSASWLRAISKMVVGVEKQAGVPQDVEWAIADGRLFLLQARPITNLPQTEPQVDPDAPTTIWDNSNIVESYSGVTSPLTFSFARHVYEHVYVEFCKLMGVPQHKIEQERNAFRNMLGFVNGHVYYNLLHWYRVLALFPGFQMNRHFMEQMMGVKHPLPDDLLKSIVPCAPTRWARLIDTLHLVGSGIGLIRSQITLPRTSKRFYKRLNEALSQPEETLHSRSLEELSNDYAQIEGKLLTQWDTPLINDFLCMIAFGLSRNALQRAAGEAGVRLHNDILIGQGDIISAEPARRMRMMATLAAQDATLVETLIHADSVRAADALANWPELHDHYTAYLAKFGNRCLQELKLESPTLQDDPSSLLRAIGQMARRLGHSPTTESHRASVPDIREQLAALLPNQPLKRWWITRLLAWCKARVRDRENLRFERTRVFGYARQVFLAIGQRLYERKLLDDPRQVFLLEVKEVLALAHGATTTYDLAGLIEVRQTQQKRFATLPAPPNRFLTQGNAFAAFQQQHYRQTMPGETTVSTQESTGYDSTGHDSTGHNNTDKDSDNSRRGIGCCAGIVRAPVRVISDPRGQSLQAGEIMVAQFTDPGWITLFANAAGILVERGSLLSHSAIVARELGIPAIVAIEGVMTWLQTGDVVEMDGASGIVLKKIVETHQ